MRYDSTSGRSTSYSGSPIAAYVIDDTLKMDTDFKIEVLVAQPTGFTAYCRVADEKKTKENFKKTFKALIPDEYNRIFYVIHPLKGQLETITFYEKLIGLNPKREIRDSMKLVINGNILVKNGD
jgi:hypothetical protein